jgi:hypothetical protein
MKKRLQTGLILVLAALLLSINGTGTIKAMDDDWSEQDCTRKVNFSTATKQRLDSIYQRIYMDYVDLIETYAWSGALSQAQKTTRLNMLKHYIETFHKRNYQWCSEHERDEWEEEWYNND